MSTRVSSESEYSARSGYQKNVSLSFGFGHASESKPARLNGTSVRHPGMASLKPRFRLDVSVRGVLETLLQKVSDFLLRGCFLHYSVVDVGYSAFAVNQRG
jgi:hypothetical protein